MNRIVMHHSGGPGTPTAEDLAHYHRVVDAGGNVHDGNHPISANEPGRPLRAGAYAAHTLNLNSGAIGVSMASMGGAEWRDPKGSTRFFPTDRQVRAFVAEVARLCRVYGIAVTPATVLTHAEVQPRLGVRQATKWDFDYDPLGISPTRDPLATGDALRKMIREAMDEARESGRPSAPPKPSPRPILRRGARGEAVRELQTLLGLPAAEVDGAFGPTTEDAVMDFQTARELLADAIVGRQTWEALLGTR